MPSRKTLFGVLAVVLLPLGVFANPYTGVTFTVPALPPVYTGRTNADSKKDRQPNGCGTKG